MSQDTEQPPPDTTDIGKLETAFEVDDLTYQVVTSFDELGLKESVLRGISNIGFNQPSPIQCRAIAPAIAGADLIAQAQSGSGKTATFVISTLQRVDTDKNVCQAIVVSPTRELAKQIWSVFDMIGKYMNLKCHAFIGGTSVQEDTNILNRGCHVVVGTPGRINHLIEQKYLITDSTIMFVLDEADEMLSRGFTSQIYNIFKNLPSGIQIMLYSATLSDEALLVTNKFMNNPVKILMKKEKLTLEGIKQYYIAVKDNNAKVECIKDLYGAIKASQVVIFVSHQKMAERLHSILEKEGHDVAFMHSGIDQCFREEVMANFRQCKFRILISTDLIARGIDVQNVSLVINFDIPSHFETYLHRIGRGGRFGRPGQAISFVIEQELQFIKELEEFYQTHIAEFCEVDFSVIKN